MIIVYVLSLLAMAAVVLALVGFVFWHELTSIGEYIVEHWL